MLIAMAWGLFAGAALLVGAVAVMIAPVPNRVIGAVMGFGAGVLVAAVAFELTAEATELAGLRVVTAGLLVGASVYLVGDWAVSTQGGHRRKSPLHGGTSVLGHQRLHALHHARQAAQLDGASPAAAPLITASSLPAAAPATAAGALVIGALLDGIPESAAIGISLLEGEGIGLAFVAAVFLSNVPEAMAASAGLLASGRSRRWVIALWSSVALVSALAAGLGYAFLGGAGPELLGSIQAFAAGAVLAMLAATMLPEAVDHAGRWVGLVTVLGFAAAVALGAL